MSIEKSIALIIPSPNSSYQLLDRCPININHFVPPIYQWVCRHCCEMNPLYGTAENHAISSSDNSNNSPTASAWLFPWPSGEARNNHPFLGQSYFNRHFRPLDTQPNLVGYDPSVTCSLEVIMVSSSVNVQLKLLPCLTTPAPLQEGFRCGSGDPRRVGHPPPLFVMGNSGVFTLTTGSLCSYRAARPSTAFAMTFAVC